MREKVGGVLNKNNKKFGIMVNQKSFSYTKSTCGPKTIENPLIQAGDPGLSNGNGFSKLE